MRVGDDFNGVVSVPRLAGFQGAISTAGLAFGLSSAYRLLLGARAFLTGSARTGQFKIRPARLE